MSVTVRARPSSNSRRRVASAITLRSDLPIHDRAAKHPRQLSARCSTSPTFPLTGIACASLTSCREIAMAPFAHVLAPRIFLGAPGDHLRGAPGGVQPEEPGAGGRGLRVGVRGEPGVLRVAGPGASKGVSGLTPEARRPMPSFSIRARAQFHSLCLNPDLRWRKFGRRPIARVRLNRDHPGPASRLHNHLRQSVE